ncbi:MAG: hypothetical protein QGG55_02800 [Verrucomicrobiota bacterium]|jgi:hypothetical protein|nr:hypothetical protein [Verrucomicrobiota bacterium]
MQGRWLIVLLGLVMWAHHLPAAVQYELVNKQLVVGDKVVGVTAQGIRFGRGFNPGQLIGWASLSTNSVLHIYNRLARENVYIQKPLAEKKAIAAAIRGRLNPRRVSGVPGGPVVPAAKLAGAVAAPGVRAKGLSLPPAPADELSERPSLRPLTPQTWRGMPGDFVPLSDPNAKQTSLFGGLFVSPISIFFYLLILGANFHLAREVADCRRRSRKLVCGLSFLVPFIVPLVFMLLPVPEGKTAPSVVRSRVAEAATNAVTVGAVQEPEPQAIPEEPQSQPVFSSYYHRDQVKFNRNFFVTELMRFNRSVPIGEWLVIRTNNEREYWAGRIVKAEEEVVTFSVVVGGIWTDQTVRYYQITEIFIQSIEG